MLELVVKPKAISVFLESSPFYPKEAYKLSVFAYVKEADEIVLLYNTLTGTLLCISTFEWSMINNKCARQYDDTEFVRDLVSYHFLVPQHLNEIDRYKELYDLVIASDSSQGISRYNILTTTGCNLRCYYCFENGIKAENMKEETARDLVDYIVNTHDNSKPVHIRWFGGEPLVNMKVIDIVSSGLKEKGINYYSTMSSNGVLFTPNVIKKISEWNLRKVRLSLDGYGKEHDKRKGFHTDGRIFNTVIQNISNLINENVKVNIRLTIDSSSIDKMGDLALWLIDRFQNNPNVSIYNRCVFQEVSSDSYEKKPEDVMKLVEKIEVLDKLLISNNIYDTERIAPIGFQAYYCAASDPHAVVICPDGKLCSCETINNDTQYWGDIWQGEVDKSCHQKWLQSTIRKMCSNCCFLPVCTPFDKCCIDYFNCKYKMQYIHNYYMQNAYNEYLIKR